MEARTIYKGPEFRTLLYDYLKKHGSIDPAEIGREEVTGSWKFIPTFAEEAIRKDVVLLYGE